MRAVFTLDIEANGLYPQVDTIWLIVIKQFMPKGVEPRVLKVHPFRGGNQICKEKILDFIFSAPSDEPPIIAAHNGLGYDMWVLWKILDMSFRAGPDKLCGNPVKFFDTYYASMHFNPDRPGGHSLEDWSHRKGSHKIDYRQKLIDVGAMDKSAPKGFEFSFYHELMDGYCEQDVFLGEKVLLDLYKSYTYEKNEKAFALGQKNFWLMAAQGFTGIEFDSESANSLKPRIESMMREIKDDVEPDLPRRELKKGEMGFYTMPKITHKKDGELSANMLKFIERHNGYVVSDVKVLIEGKEYFIVGGSQIEASMPMTLDDSNALKDYFLGLGWEPTMYNFQKDAKGKPVRDENRQLILTSPKIQESGKICPNLLELEGDLPKKIVKYLSLKNRHSILKGWLANPRLAWDGRLSAGSSGISNTYRQRHNTVVNVPKAQDDVLLGKEFRALFRVGDGMDLIGCDQAALEARVQGSWTFPHDGGETARILLEKDPHSRNAKAFYPKETDGFDIDDPEFDKDHPGFKPYRSRSKNGGYAIMYGCAPPKLAATLGLPVNKGNELLNAYWEANEGTKKLKDEIEKFWETKGDCKWIYGLDGRKLYSRSKHSLLNLLFQSSGAIIVDYSVCLFDMKMGEMFIDSLGRPYYLYKDKIVRRVLYVHDEYGVEANSTISSEVAQIMEKTMSAAGTFFKMNIELKGEAKIGKNWMETH